MPKRLAVCLLIGRSCPLGRVTRSKCDGPFGSGLKSDHYTDKGALVVRLQNIRPEGFAIGEPAYVEEAYFDRELRSHEVLPGDLLIAGLGDDNNLVGRACVAPDGLRKALVKADVFRFRIDTNKCLPDYLAMLLSATADSDGGRLASGSTRQRIPLSVMASRAIACPTRDEQAAIVSFINSETAKIDALVEEQKRLVELLKEKRQAVISQAVTKGLTPNVPMKDSGVEWLGEVPAHWQTSRLANLYSDTDERGNDDLPVLTVSIHDGVSDDELDEADMDRKVTRSDDKTKYKRVQPGDLVYNMMRAWQGGFGTVTVDGMVSPAYVVARPRTPFPTAFIESILRTPNAIEEMRGRSRGVTDFRLRLYWEEFKEIVVPRPPKAEVEAILEHLHEWNSRVADTVSAAEDCISILQERRSALISAAVTGKIDVRGLAPQHEGAAA